ncbi:hypothetical protein KKH18_10210, partial [bacterium]|nr:hypothetical protein [bacterium]
MNCKHLYRLSTSLRRALLFLTIAYSTTMHFNTLQAADLDVEYRSTFAKWDSTFKTVYDPTKSPGKGQGWKPYNRWAWFYGQRADDSGINPIDARMQAWQEKQLHRRPASNLDENWTVLGPENMAGRILTLAYDPTNTNIVYAGSASGGLWKSTDGTLSWFPLTDDLPSLAVGCVAIDPNNHNTLYIGTGEGSFNVDAVYGAGIFKSTDGGTTWNTTGMSWTQSQQRAVNEIVIDPNNSQILYAATNSSGNGVYK